MTITPPTNISTGVVTARLSTIVGDGPDVGTVPDFEVPSVRIKFDPKAKVLTDLTAAPAPLILLPQPIYGVFDADGYLCREVDGAAADTPGIELIANDDPDLNPAQWSWEASYVVTLNGRSIAGPAPHAVIVPSGGTVDLAGFIDVTAAPVLGVAAAEAMAALAAGSAVEAAASVAEAALSSSDAADSAAAAEAYAATIPGLVDDAIADAAEVQLAGLELGYAETATTFSTTSTASGALVPGIVVTVVGQGRPVDIEAFGANLYHSVASAGVIPYISVNGASLGGIASYVYSPKTTSGPPAIIKRRMVLTAGVSYTFRLGLYGAAAGTSYLVSSTYAYSYLSVISR